MVGMGSGSGGGIGSGNGSGYGPGVGGNVGGGIYRVGGGVPASGVDRATDAFQQGDVSTNAFDDFFEYALAQPVTIHKNESAMVPILQQELPAEHVTLWSEQEATPLRAVWLENKSNLTLDSGSFSIFEAASLPARACSIPSIPAKSACSPTPPIRPFASSVTARDTKRKLHHVADHQRRHRRNLAWTSSSAGYSATNSADVERVVLIEHAAPQQRLVVSTTT